MPLSASTRRPDLEHLPPPAWIEALGPGALGHVLELDARGFLVLRIPVVVGERKALVLGGEPDGVSERRDPALELGGALVELEPVVAHVADPLDADERGRFLARAAADAGDEEVGADEPPELGLRCGRHLGELGPVDDGREGSVDVEQERRLVGRLAERGQQIHRTRIRA